MATRIPPSSDVSIDDLLERAAELKSELVAFGQGPRFARRLDTVLFEAADEDGFLDEGAAILAMDYFLLQRRLSDGRTVLERFVGQRRPPLSDDEREMLLGWHEVVDGCFEVRRFDGDAVLLHNLVDDLVYRVHSNMGRKGFAGGRAGMFLVGRIVPLHPATDMWMLSGTHTRFPKSARRQVAVAAVRQLWFEGCVVAPSTGVGWPHQLDRQVGSRKFWPHEGHRRRMPSPPSPPRPTGQASFSQRQENG